MTPRTCRETPDPQPRFPSEPEKRRNPEEGAGQSDERLQLLKEKHEMFPLILHLEVKSLSGPLPHDC